MIEVRMNDIQIKAENDIEIKTVSQLKGQRMDKSW